VSGAIFWLSVTALVLLAWAIKRRRDRRLLEVWGEEEDGGRRYH
jgi:hypothetical protein